MDDIAYVYQQDIRDKKRSLSGVFARTGKRGYVGKMYMPSDIMSRKDKYNYRKNGKVVKYNMYDQILTIEEFKQKTTEEQFNLMTVWRNKYSNSEIRKAMGVANAYFYKICNDLGVQKKRYQTKKVRQKQAASSSVPTVIEPMESPAFATQQLLELIRREKAESDKVIEYRPVKEDGFQVSYNGSYLAEDVVRKIEKIALLLSDESGRYQVSIDVRELATVGSED